MAVQNRVDSTTVSLIKSGYSFVKNETISRNAGRTTPLLRNTIMALNATTREWVPFTSLVAINGESVPRGIYLGDDIPAADLVIGDIADCPIMVGGCCTVDENIVVFDDDTLNVDSIVNPATIEARTLRYALSAASGIFLELTEAISEFEN